MKSISTLFDNFINKIIPKRSITEMALKTIAVKKPSIIETKSTVTTIPTEYDIEKDLLHFYRVTRLNWNASDYDSPVSDFVGFCLSKYKLYYTDVNQLKHNEIKTKLNAREPHLNRNGIEIPLYDFTFFNRDYAENAVIDKIKRLNTQELARLKNYAIAGNPTAALWQAFLSTKNNPAEAKKYLEQAAEKNDIAKFILIRNKLFGSPKWGISRNITEAIHNIVNFPLNSNKVYSALCVQLLFEAIKENIISKEMLPKDLQNKVTPLLNEYHNPRALSPYSLPGRF